MRLQADGDKARELAVAAKDYLARAEALLRPPPPRLVAVGGLSGSGKSTLALRLAPGTGAAPGALVLRSDVVRKKLFGVAPSTRLGVDAYAPPITDQVYRLLAEQAGAALGAGHAVVVDAVFGDLEQRAAMAAVAAQARVPFAGVWLEAPTGVLAARIEDRRGDASDATLEVLESQAARDLGPIAWTRIEASGDPATVQRRAEAAIEGRLTPPR
jgi:predicted kinase